MNTGIATAEHLLDLFQDEMCKQIRLHTTDIEEYKQWIMPLEVKEGESMHDAAHAALSDVQPEHVINEETLFSEYGCLICKIDGSCYMSNCHVAKGSFAHIPDPKTCFARGGDIAGYFHIHPIGLPIPSTTDINFSLRITAPNNHKNFFFIGGKIKGRCVIVCYIVDETSKVRYEVFKKVTAANTHKELCHPPTDNCLGVIFTHNRHPGLPTSIVLHFTRRYFNNIYPPDRYSEEERENARKTIDDGNIPAKIKKWISKHQPKNALECVPVYDDNVTRDSFERRLEQLSKFCRVVVRWCD